MSDIDTPDDDLLLFDDEAPNDDEGGAGSGCPPSERPTAPPWTVLVVDDDPGVQQVTRLALGGFRIDGRPLQLLHASSAAEAQTLLAAHPETALVLLDVVMETDDAGLRFADWIRTELGNRIVRVVLRTGQPGIAPEESVMSRYDIHDYQSKTDVSAQRLRTSVTGGIRAYRDLRTVTLQRQGLEKVLHATGSLFAQATLSDLLSGILEQVAALLFPSENALFFLARAPLFEPRTEEPAILAAAGRFAARIGEPVASVLDPSTLASMEGLATPGQWRFVGEHGLFGFAIVEGSVPALFLENAAALSDWERQMVALYCSSAAMALRNQRLAIEREEVLTASARFVPTAFLELLDKVDIRRLAMGDQVVRELTVCFFDIQGFTRRSEALGPERVLALLNRIYGVVGPIVARHGGVVDKYLGDGVMVLFPEGRAAAVDALVEVQRAMVEFNATPDLVDDPVILRSSLDHGPVILATVGHAGRFDTTVISDVSNVSARLQELCRVLDVAILGTRAAIGEGLVPHSRSLGFMPLRGRAEPVELVELYGAQSPEVIEARNATAAEFALAVQHRARGEWLAAVSALQGVLTRSPDDPVATWMLADSASSLQREARPRL
jgi:class 3 adenylate cyclase/CheY-like chemotaxis protein